MSAPVVRSAMACDDIRTEEGGKLIAIGLLNPHMDVEGRGSGAGPAGIRLHFLASLDVAKAGEYELWFRLVALKARRGQTMRMTVVFQGADKQIPFPVGPLAIPIADEETGFKLQQRINDVWRTVGTWHFTP